MIPILYEKTETAFISNGLGRLRDCISCIVTEERNGIYECDFEYPMDGVNYERIQVGRIIGVTHDESDDIQPFDIVSFEKPINGVVTFHCVHISYRMSYMSIRGVNKNSLAEVFTHIKTYSQPGCPFTFWTDKSSTGYVSSFNNIPHTVRETLGGIEGSLLDVYGGEYEWDKWTVKLWSARGQYRDFTIRYGVNMLDYNEEYDMSGCFSSCRPYWTDGTSYVVGDKQNSGMLPPSGRDQCIPLDVSDKFEDQPTKAQVEAMGKSVMTQQNSTVPSQNITVSFARLQDMGEFAAYQNLLQCKLCDTINVIFPDFNSGGQFKIVRTVWNVLTGRYDEMELGDLTVSLSEALGITSYQNASTSTIEQIQKELTTSVESPSITSITTGTLVEAYVVRNGKIVTLTIGVKKSTATSAGSNVFVATLESQYCPKYLVNGSGYAGSSGGVMQLLGTGSLTVHIIGAQLSANTTIYVSTTYVIE